MKGTDRQTPPAILGVFSRVSTFEEINTPGAWISDTGTLVRVPEDGLKAGHSPVINVVSNETMGFTRVSNDPYIPIGKARQLAANADLPVKF